LCDLFPFFYIESSTNLRLTNCNKNADKEFIPEIRQSGFSEWVRGFITGKISCTKFLKRFYPDVWAKTGIDGTDH